VTHGAVNSLLDAVGLGSWRQNWLGDLDLALWSVVAVIVWQFAGYQDSVWIGDQPAGVRLRLPSGHHVVTAAFSKESQ
jgi:hypothetical protein